MKVYIGRYPPHWFSSVHSDYMNKKYGLGDWSAEYTTWERFLLRVEGALQTVYRYTVNRIPLWDDQFSYVKINGYDTWNMYSTLARVIHPALVKFREDLQGAPQVDPEDLSEELRNAEDVDVPDDEDPLFFKKWDYIVGEMAWAFEQKTLDWEEQFYTRYDDEVGERCDHEGMRKHHDRMVNGFRLFGKYYEHMRN